MQKLKRQHDKRQHNKKLQKQMDKQIRHQLKIAAVAANEAADNDKENAKPKSKTVRQGISDSKQNTDEKQEQSVIDNVSAGEEVKIREEEPQEPQEPQCVLFLDNMGAHPHAEALTAFNKGKVLANLLPPNTTPVLQPLDHTLNSKFKLNYTKAWSYWYNNVRPKTHAGNDVKPNRDDIECFVAKSFYSLTKDNIVNSWKHTLCGDEILAEANINHDERIKNGVKITIPVCKILVKKVKPYEVISMIQGEKIRLKPVKMPRGGKKRKTPDNNKNNTENNDIQHNNVGVSNNSQHSVSNSIGNSRDHAFFITIYI